MGRVACLNFWDPAQTSDLYLFSKSLHLSTGIFLCNNCEWTISFEIASAFEGRV